MKRICFLVVVAVAACNRPERSNDTMVQTDTLHVKADSAQKPAPEKPTDSVPEIKMYANERFKEVTVEKTGEHTFLIQGKGQIFEASFSWVVEDGHEELKKGYQMTDAGAPEWGKFSFTIDVEKRRANSTLMLILFESSPKDGSRQYELPVLLY